MGSGGIEPPTSRLSGVCSLQLSYKPQRLLWYLFHFPHQSIEPASFFKECDKYFSLKNRNPRNFFTKSSRMNPNNFYFVKLERVNHFRTQSTLLAHSSFAIAKVVWEQFSNFQTRIGELVCLGSMRYRTYT